MRRVRVKICGIRRLEDLTVSVAQGADALGFNFYKESRRYLTIDQAVTLRRQMPPFVSAVALVVNPERIMVDEIIETVCPDVLQFHGEEDNDFCRSFNLPFIKSIGFPSTESAEKRINAFPDAMGVLLDTQVGQKSGGTGQVFDWELIPANVPKPLILAGGLSALNVSRAIEQVRPFAVDVSSGVETKGFKDADKISKFMSAVYNSKTDRV